MCSDVLCIADIFPPDNSISHCKTRSPGLCKQLSASDSSDTTKEKRSSAEGAPWEVWSSLDKSWMLFQLKPTWNEAPVLPDPPAQPGPSPPASHSWEQTRTSWGEPHGGTQQLLWPGLAWPHAPIGQQALIVSSSLKTHFQDNLQAPISSSALHGGVVLH